jgi:hypothetical protein
MEWLASSHAAYILAAYGFAVLVLGGLHFFIWRSLRRIEQQGGQDANHGPA